MTSVRKAYKSKGDDASLSRYVKDDKVKRKRIKQPVLLGFDHPVIEAGRSLFYRKGITGPRTNILVSGHSNVKIGRDVRKGHFRGYWIYTLSLEERATCPRSCAHWSDCYGNNMPFAKRVDHTDHRALCDAIEADLVRLLAVRGRKGVMVRLHALGDFYSVPYVEFWRTMLTLHPRLAIWGYTARQPGTEIGRAIALTKRLYPDRFRVRWSDGDAGRDCTVSIARAEDCPSNAFVCPEQTGATVACATCAACWSGDKTVAFIEH